MSKFDAGPWSVIVTPERVRVVCHPDPQNPSADGFSWPLYGGEDAEMDAVTIANAHLIAAAPDLYAVVKAELDSGRNFGGDGDLYQAARAAIAKATPNTKGST